MSTIETKPLPRLLTVRETAEALRLSPPSVYRKISEGTIPALRSGRSLRVPLAELRRSLGLEDDE